LFVEFILSKINFFHSSIFLAKYASSGNNMLLEAFIKPKLRRFGNAESFIKGVHASLAEAP